MYLLYSLTFCACLWLSNSLTFAQTNLPLQPGSTGAPNTEESSYHNTDFEYLFAELKTKTPEEIFKAANEALASQDYKTAIQSYRILNGVYPLSEYAERACVNTIEAYHNQWDIDNVIEEVGKFVTLYPTSQYLEKVYYLAASVHFRRQDYIAGFLYRLFRFEKLDPAYCLEINELTKAVDSFSKFLQGFPTGVYSARAQEKIEEIKQLMARRDYYIAGFYFKSGNYVAAYNRIVNLLERYTEIHEVLPRKYASNLDRQYHIARRRLGLIPD